MMHGCTFITNMFSSTVKHTFQCTQCLSPCLYKGVVIDLLWSVRWCLHWANCLLLGNMLLFMRNKGSKISYFNFFGSLMMMLHLDWWQMLSGPPVGYQTGLYLMMYLCEIKPSWSWSSSLSIDRSHVHLSIYKRSFYQEFQQISKWWSFENSLRKVRHIGLSHGCHVIWHRSLMGCLP